MACSSGCPTPGVHKTFGECIRGKALQIADVTAHQHRVSQESQVSEYIDARNEGMQPQSLSKADVQLARDVTKATGVPFRADAV
jgi:hypothetical protein